MGSSGLRQNRIAQIRSPAGRYIIAAITGDISSALLERCHRLTGKKKKGLRVWWHFKENAAVGTCMMLEICSWFEEKIIIIIKRTGHKNVLYGSPAVGFKKNLQLHFGFFIFCTIKCFLITSR